MIKQALFSGLAAWALAIALCGCDNGKSCEQLCMAANECPDVIPSDKSCAVQCQEQAKIVAAGKCEEVQAEFDACRNAIGDVCKASTSCPSEAIARNACVDKYCADNPTMAGCEM